MKALSRVSVVTAALLAPMLLMGAASAWGADHYVVTDLGTLGGSTSFGLGISPSGEVVGYSFLASSAHDQAFIYSNGSMTDVGTLAGGSYSRASGVNAAGQIVGWSDTATAQRAFLYSNGTMTDLGTLSGWYGSTAAGINDAGQVVGSALPQSVLVRSTPPAAAFLYANGQMTDLGVLASSGYTDSAAYAINGNGLVIGSAFDLCRVEAGGPVLPPGYMPPHGFLFDSNTASLTDLGTLAGYDAITPYGINAGGQVVGNAGADSYGGTAAYNGGHAFLYNNHAITDLGTLGGTSSCAAAINISGQIVGRSNYLPGSDVDHAFIYSSGTMSDLNALTAPDSGWTLSQANAINDSGWIAGTGTNTAGLTHAFLLRPALPGDANLDGKVDINDLTVVLASFGQTTSMNWSTGDFNGDGKVDVNDLTILLSDFGKRVGVPTGVNAVPEPSVLMLSFVGAVSLLAYVSRRREHVS